jgi:hypothetical protein
MAGTDKTRFSWKTFKIVDLKNWVQFTGKRFIGNVQLGGYNRTCSGETLENKFSCLRYSTLLV